MIMTIYSKWGSESAESPTSAVGGRRWAGKKDMSSWIPILRHCVIIA